MSLHGKLSLAFISIAAVGILLAGALGIWYTHAFRDRRHFEEEIPLHVSQLLDYYEKNNQAWGDVELLPLNSYVMLLDHDYNPLGEEHHTPPEEERQRKRRFWSLKPLPKDIRLRDLKFMPRDMRFWDLKSIPDRQIVYEDEVIGILRVVEVPPQLGGPMGPATAQSPMALWGFGALIVTAGLSGVFMSRRITRPVQELTEATRAVAAGDLEQRVSVRSRDEVGVLAAAFNTMSEELREAQLQKRRMTQDIVHDLAQPILVIRGLAESMRDGILPCTEENLDVIYQEAGRLETLSRSLHLLEQVDSNRLHLNVEPSAPRAILERVGAMYAEAARRAGMKLEIRLAEDVPDVLADSERIIQALGNLVDNAFQHAPQGSRIVLAATAEGDEVHLSVMDEGPGVPEDELDRIFERFHQTDKSRSHRRSSGSGIGLAIVRSLIEAHGGRAWAKLALPQGLEVILALSKAPGASAADPKV